MVSQQHWEELLHLVKSKQQYSAQVLLQQWVESCGNIIAMTGRKVLKQQSTCSSCNSGTQTVATGEKPW